MITDKIQIIPRKKIEDGRGWFLKAITGFENGLPDKMGEIYTVYSENGASRGGHYHKNATEWFTLLTGISRLELKDINSNEYMSIDLDANEPVTIVVPPDIAHRFDSIENNSFLLLAYTDVIYNPSDTLSLDF